MSPTTLYREGTDLDELLAELDAEYPGQVQVLEITHPREGGVLGFFARQRVGVHYRLADALPADDPFMTALAAARGRAATMAEAVPVGAVSHAGAGAPGRVGSSMTGRGPVGGFGGGVVGGRADTGLDVLGDADVPAGVAAAAAAIAESVAAEVRERSAAQAVADEAVVTARTVRPATGLGPDPETLAAALAGRAVPPAGGAAGVAGAGDPFASLLASIAVKRPAANLGFRVPAQTARDAVPAAEPSRAAARAAALYEQRPVPQDGATPANSGLDGEAARASLIGDDEPATTTPRQPAGIAGPVRQHADHPAARAGASATGYAPADLTATDFAAAGFDIVSAPEPEAEAQDTISESPVPVGAGTPAPARPAITLNRGARRATPAPAVGTTEPVAWQPAERIDTSADLAPTAPGTPLDAPAAFAAEPPAPAAWQPAERISTRTGLAAAEHDVSVDDPAPADIPGEQPAPRNAEPAGLPAGTDETDTPTATRRRTAPLAWPIAQPTNRAATGGADGTGNSLQLTLRRGTPAEGVTGAPAAEAASSEARGSTMVLPRQSRPQAEQAMTSSSFTETPAGTQRATSLALRRQLLEIGVPVDRVPGDAVHTYAAIEQLVQALPPAPAAPSRPGEILVVAGAARDVVAAADGLLTAAQTAFEGIWTFGCPAAVGTRRIPTNGATVLTDAEQARTVAAEARAEHTGPLLVVIATDTTAGREQAADVIAAISPDSVWAAVDATRKPADVRRALAPAGRLDGMIVTHAERSSSPATVWELELPIALVDGRASTGPVWAVLLLDKLGELAREEGAACSGARC